MSKTKSGMIKTAGFMAIATLLAKLCGLARESLIAAYFSTGIDGTAYLTATQLPMTLFDIVIGGVITSSFIPIFNDLLEKKDKETAMAFANKFMCMILMICVLISVFGIVFADELIYFMAPKFDMSTHNLAVTLSSIMFPMVIFTGLAFSFVGILQSFGEFNIPAIMSLVSNVAVILYFPIFGKKFGVYGLSVAMLFSWSLQVIIQLPSLKKFGFKPKPSLKIWNSDMKRALLLAGPILISTWVQPLYSIVNTRIASGIDGAVPVLNYANRLYIVITGVFSFVVTNLVFPKMSRANSSEDENETNSLLVGSLKAVTLVILPIMAVFIILSEPIIKVIYDHGKFDAVEVTSLALSCYSLGMIGMALNEVLSKAFFSMKNSKTPMINAVISMLFNIVAAYALSAMFGVGGLALAAACGSIINAFLNYVCMRKKRGQLFKKEDYIDILKIVLASIAMAITVIVFYIFTRKWNDAGIFGSILTGIVCGGSGLAIYSALIIVFKVSAVDSVLKEFRFMRKKRGK